MNLSVILNIIGIIIGLFVLAYYIAYVVAEYKILEKEGEKGWKSLIPIYNFYVTYKIEGVFVPWFFFASTCFILEFIESCLEAFRVHIPLPLEIIFLLATVLMLITESVFSVNLGRSFGKSTAFKVGLVLFPHLFYMILAFGKSKFIHHNKGEQDAGLQNSKA